MIVLTLYLLVGWLLASWLLPTGELLERVATAALLGLAAPPWLGIQLAWLTGTRLHPELLAASAGVLLVPLGIAAVRGRIRAGLPSWERADVVALALAIPITAAAWMHYSEREYTVALGSWLTRGEAKCFAMLSFELAGGLGAGGLPREAAWDIISTPGNALFTGGCLPILGADGFRLLFAACWLLTAAFVFLGARPLAGARAAAAAAIVAIAHPLWLFTEVLDRNALACMLGAALLHVALHHPRRVILQGLLLGLLAGAGLRFLPATFALTTTALLMQRRAPLRDHATVLGLALALFAFNVPHLRLHGLYSLGETEPWYRLLAMALTTPTRTPFQPFGNASGQLLLGLSSLGTVLGAATLLGAWQQRTRPMRLAALLAPAVLTWAVVATQRDWYETDKTRILLTAFPPLLLLLAVGLKELRRPRMLAALAAGALLLQGGSWALRSAQSPVDPGAHARRPTWQTESPAWATLLQSAFPVGPLPAWRQLGDKIDWPRKRAEDRLVAGALFSPPPRAIPERYVPAGAKVVPKDRPDPVTLTVHLDRLVDDLPNAAELGGESPFVDLTDRDALYDVHWTEVDVPWQAAPLPVAAFPLQGEPDALGELRLELNAFAGFGPDDLGFERVAPIHQRLRPEHRNPAGDLRALPPRDRNPAIVLRIDRSERVRLRTWLIDPANGTPWRIDSWTVELQGDRPVVRFWPLEPESYL